MKYVSFGRYIDDDDFIQIKFFFPFSFLALQSKEYLSWSIKDKDFMM